MNDPGDRPQRLLPGLLLVLVAAPAHAVEGGLRIVPELPILILLVIAFALLVLPVNALLFRPIFRVLDAREERIAGSRRRADQLAREAGEVTARYEDALRKAREENARTRADRVGVARREAASDLAGAREAADREIEAARKQLGALLEDSRGVLRVQTEELARQAAARLLGRAL